MQVSWNWLSSVCRQKRILILLCTFGSSFIAFNYSLLSSTTSTTTSQSLVNSFATNKIDEGDSFSLDLQKNYKGELNHDHQKWKDKSTLHVDAAVSSSSFTKLPQKFEGRVLKKESLPLSSSVSHHYNDKSSTFINFNTYFPQSLSRKSPEIPEELSSTTKHAQASFKKFHNFESNTRWKNESPLNLHHQNIRVNDNSSHNNNVKFIESAIEEKSENNTITSSVVIAQKTKSNKVPQRKTDDQVEKPDVITLSSLENVEKSITRVIRTDFPVESNSIGSSLVAMRPTSPEVPLELNSSSSSQPEQIALLFHASSDMDMDSGTNNSNHPFPPPQPSPIFPKSNLLSPTPPPPPPPQRSFRIPPCNTTFQLHRIQKRKKNLTVIENFIMGWMHVKCNESITYTTHGDYRYLDNLVPLVDRWNGPVSLSIYCPGEDLEETLKLISYFKLCTSSNVNKWVTIHLIYDTSKRPAGMSSAKAGDIPWLDTLYQQGKWKDCSQKPTFGKGNTTFRIQNGLLYPINIARNVARAAAQTYFVLASDIELYPSINLIPSFMEMIGRLQKKEEEKQRINYYTKRSRFTAAAAAVVAKIFFPGAAGDDEESNLPEAVTSTEQNEVQLQRDQQNNRLSSDLYHNRQSQRSRHVFVLPVFEVRKDIVPCQCETKEQLVSLLKYRAAVIFHHSICPQCHTFPKYEEWKVLYPGSDGGEPLRNYRKYNCSGNGTNYANSTFQPASHQPETMRIFHKAKRKHPYQLWEPIFIGTKDEPIYDERLSWEGLRDKMVSGYIMCTLDYDFYILDNAFLVHKPGIRRVNHLVTRTVMSQDRLINFRIRSELLKKFGKHDECAL